MSLVGERIKEAFSARTRKTCAGNCICTGNHILRAFDTYYCNCIIYACNSSGYNKYIVACQCAARST